ncbi:MAG: ATP phosphoribosyltransferase regulatory subunit [Burkholderiales bacterium]|nr:ATP phosphoribosyltransferase regulatory subunit [Burkholderiales bacterium]
MRNWLLPEFIEDSLPTEAARIEMLRRTLLDEFRAHGYELVAPPMLEYLESLLTGTGHDLDLRTFKLVDQLSGRMMGVRADITPQVARIDAHLLNRDGVTRLCYCGSVLHTRPRAVDATREPLQAGAEIYGHAGIESDLEIQRLLFSALSACGVGAARLDLGHVGVFRALCRRAAIGPELEGELHEALEAKDRAALQALCAGLPAETRAALAGMPGLYGDSDVIERARRELPDYPEIAAALGDLERLSLDNRFQVGIDLADLRGYHYHSGVVFSAYVEGRASAVALGGRYDEVGKAFGRARAATGFSLDLRTLARLLPGAEPPGAILAPWDGDAALAAEIARLRGAGEIVIQALPAARDGEGCTRELVKGPGGWQARDRAKRS